MKQLKNLNQKGFDKFSSHELGFAPVLIVIPLAIILVIGAIAYGYFVATQQSAPQTSEIPTFQPSSAPVRLGTPGCEDVDYTGCDTSADFMTWTDTGERNPTE